MQKPLYERQLIFNNIYLFASKSNSKTKFKVTELLSFLDTNHYIAYLCDFKPFRSLPSYSVFQRFIKYIDNESLK
jgi:hypothetical protein